MTELSPLFLDSWVEFNCRRWDVKPVHLEYHPNDSELPLLRAILYTDRKGRILLPPRNPYLAIFFRPTPSQHSYALSSQWQQTAGLLAVEMHQRGFANFDIALPPEAEDVRPWQWLGFRAAIRYCQQIDLPFDLSLADNMVRKQIKKSLRFSCSCDRTTNMSEIFACLRETEVRQSFRLTAFSQQELDMAQRMVGVDNYRAYFCQMPNGELASALVVLHQPGSCALALFFGTKSAYLNTGAARLLVHYALTDLHAVGAVGFDFGGVSTPSVAMAKEALGGQVKRYYSLEDYSTRQFGRWVLNYYRHLRYPQTKLISWKEPNR